jgi:hypothetical protein
MRKHDEVIRAWLDGKDIQYKYKNDTKWLDTSKEVSVNPMTYNELMWRIKPEARTIVIPSIIKLKNVTASFDEDKREIIVKFEEAGEDSDGE